ncbi:hypothetical protein U3516DRAFT_789079 [Neocallimastix sp. 'constans']
MILSINYKKDNSNIPTNKKEFIEVFNVSSTKEMNDDYFVFSNFLLRKNTMNSTDYYSILTYDESIKYFENLKCNSDSDCPERSTCIGNKCITTFYCKKNDKSTCAFFTNLCDGKPCYRTGHECNKNEECLNNECHSLVTGGGYCPQINIDEYPTSFFSYENAETYYKNLDIECSATEECQNHSFC